MCELLFSQALLFLSQGFSYVSRIREMDRSILQSGSFFFLSKGEVSAIKRSNTTQYSSCKLYECCKGETLGRSLEKCFFFSLTPFFFACVCAGCVIGQVAFFSLLVKKKEEEKNPSRSYRNEKKGRKREGEGNCKFNKF